MDGFRVFTGIYLLIMFSSALLGYYLRSWGFLFIYTIMAICAILGLFL